MNHRKILGKATLATKPATLAARWRVWLYSAALILTGVATNQAETWTLPAAIQFALTNSPEIHLAQQRIRAAQAGLDQANAAFSPQVQFQSSYLRTDNPTAVFGSVLNHRSYSASLIQS
jgi:outer membrane protein TolC